MSFKFTVECILRYADVFNVQHPYGDFIKTSPAHVHDIVPITVTSYVRFDVWYNR